MIDKPSAESREQVRRSFFGYEEVLPGDRLKFGHEDYVYFIQPKDGGLIKIGTTSSPYKRLNEMMNMSPLPLALRRVLRVRPAGYGRAAESEFHRRFAHLRKHGEWFWPSPELAEVANAIPAAPNEVDGDGLDRLTTALSKRATR